MTLLEQAREFRVAFGQEIPGCISRYGFIKKALWDMQVGLINEESCEFLEAAEECYADPENMQRREDVLKEAADLSDLVYVCYQLTASPSMLLLLALIWIRLWIVFTSQT